jgi:hypothetical protein
MSRNGSGVYSLPAGNPVVTNTTISTTWANSTLTDLATAMTGSVASDGQTPITGNLQMGANRITGLADGIAATDATTLTQVNTAIATAGATYLLKASNLSDVANATTARGNLTAAKSGANSDITSLTGLTTPLTVAQGGTGAATLTANNVLLGNGTSAPQAVAPSTSGNVLTSNGTTWTSVAGAYVLTNGTTQASTSGTSIDFTSLPSWVKRVTVMFSGVSTNGSSVPQIQLGTGSTTYTTTGYLGASFASTNATTNFNTGALISPDNGAVNIYHGSVIISTLGSNIWVFQGCLGRSNSADASFMGGQISLSAVLTAVRITTVNGTDAFDAGSINILYE